MEESEILKLIGDGIEPNEFLKQVGMADKDKVPDIKSALSLVSRLQLMVAQKKIEIVTENGVSKVKAKS